MQRPVLLRRGVVLSTLRLAGISYQGGVLRRLSGAGTGDGLTELMTGGHR